MNDQLEGQVSMFDLVSPFGRTCPEPSQAIKAETSKQSCKPSAKSPSQMFQFLSLKKGNGARLDASWAMAAALPGGRTTLSIGESPSETEIQAMCDRLGPHNVAVESTLSQILQANAPEKYFLSKTACEGILRRAARRGKELPQMLKDALEEVVALA